MQLSEYDGQLDGLAGRKKKRGFKRIGRGLKKLLKPIAHIGAAVFTGGASLALSASMLRARGERKTAAAMMAREDAAQAQAQAQAQREEFEAPPPDWITHAARSRRPAPPPGRYFDEDAEPFTPVRRMAPPARRYFDEEAEMFESFRRRTPDASGLIPAPQIAPAANLVRALLPEPTPTRYTDPGSNPVPFAPDPSASPGGMPQWAIPAAIAGGVVLLMLTQRGRP